MEMDIDQYQPSASDEPRIPLVNGASERNILPPTTPIACMRYGADVWPRAVDLWQKRALYLTDMFQ